MAIFSTSRFCFEKRIAGKSQDNFVTVVMHNKILSKFFTTKINLVNEEKNRDIKSIVERCMFLQNDLTLFSKIKSDFWKTGVKCLCPGIYQKIQKIEDRLNRKKIKMSLPEENT